MKSICALTGALALGVFGCAQNNSGDVAGSGAQATQAPTDQNTAPSKSELQSISYMSTDVAGFSHPNEAKNCADFKLAMRHNHLQYPVSSNPAYRAATARFLSDAQIEALPNNDQLFYFQGKIIQYRDTDKFAVWDTETPEGHPLRVVVLQDVAVHLGEESHLNPSHPWFKAFAQPGRALCGLANKIMQEFGDPVTVGSVLLMDRDN